MTRHLPAAIVLAVLALPATGATHPDAAAETCSFAAPNVLPEPAFTRGDSNTIRWEHVPKSCWIGEDNSGKASTERRFTVRITNLGSGKTESVTVNGEDEVDATIDPNELPRGPNGEIDGVRFEYTVVRKEKWCSSGSPSFGTCQVTSTRTSTASSPVSSTQDMRRPSGSLELAAGATFVRSLRVPARITAADPAGAGGQSGSGAGYVELAATPQFEACRRDCVQALGGPVTAQLQAGPDGVRVVHARVYDRARRAADDPGTTSFGIPPGNVSQPFTDSVVLDTTPPQLFVRLSTTRATAGTAVTYDASQTVDRGGTGADSGVEPGSAVWTFGDGATGGGLITTHAYAAPGSYTVAVSVSDGVGNVRRTELGQIVVVAAPVAPLPQTTSTPSTPAPAATDRRAPSLSALAVRRRGGRLLLAFRLSERAGVVVEVRRLAPRPQRTLGSFVRAVGAGRRELTVPVRLTRRLRAKGRYRFALAARDPSGNRAAVRFVQLTVR